MQRLPLAESVPTELEVWQLLLDTGREPTPDAWRLLSHTEQARARRFHHLADRVRAVATRAALRRLLSERVGVAADALTFSENAYGKPLLSGVEGPAFNVSHAGNVALIALASSGAVGVDIERQHTDAELEALYDLLLSPSERAEHDGGEGGLPLIERWVVKEATLKALGVGIAEHLPALSVFLSSGQRNAYRLDYRLAAPPLEAWAISAPAGYIAALACADRTASERYSTHSLGGQPCTAMAQHQ
ncbi:4'-phosphopantetheinyl transferase superfamily protein [Halomonas sp. KM-1]|uniref:4'-phosphopantetheinyl transferase family protein n=1 Tax=Halomonas sp. KM-1 TaxID=590061 RepID=UPI000289DA3A|nr:4'-phosphopantetheinyl transferase superfamily protein [Halomonas sp. KM-1]